MTNLTIAHDTWLMVGDGEKALFFRNEGDAAFPNLEIVDVLNHPNPASRDQGSDRPGRVHSSYGTARSAVQETNWHKLEKHRFAKEIAGALYTAARDNQYSQLIVVAPPMTLGDLRKEMHPEVSSRVVAEVHKTLTSMPAHEIERVLFRHQPEHQ